MEAAVRWRVFHRTVQDIKESNAGQADYLVTGDKGGLLSLTRHQGTRIISARAFAAMFA